MTGPWTMPSWMEPFREFIRNTGGNSVEDLMNNHTANTDINAPLALLCVAVKSQVALLQYCYENGALPLNLLKQRDDLLASNAELVKALEPFARKDVACCSVGAVGGGGGHRNSRGEFVPGTHSPDCLHEAARRAIAKSLEVSR